MAGEKSEKATPKRRSDERKKGNVLKSQDIVTVVSLVSMFYFLKMMMPFLVSTIQNFLYYFADQAATKTNLVIADMNSIYTKSVMLYVMTAVPTLLFSIFVGVVGTGAQTRFLISKTLLKFKMSRLNPISGIGKMFSIRSLVELTKSMIKIVALLYIIYSTVVPKLEVVPRLMEMSLPSALTFLGGLIMSIVENVTIAFVFIAILDFAYQWFDYEKNIRMSKQEIKDEYKQMEGDPQIKGKIRDRQREMSQRRMMQDVPKADVIIRNPTHFAIAIAYDETKHRAPIVLAKGMDHVALKIIEIAEEHDILMTENKPLARGLYESVEINQEIPEEFYQAMAEVLAFVYRMKQKGAHNEKIKS